MAASQIFDSLPDRSCADGIWHICEDFRVRLNRPFGGRLSGGSAWCYGETVAVGWLIRDSSLPKSSVKLTRTARVLPASSATGL